MGLEINRTNATQQLTDMNVTLQNAAMGVRDAKINIEIFINSLSLQGETYDGFRVQYKKLHDPVLNGMLCYFDEMLYANKSYSDKMAYLKGDYLQEDALQSQIAQAQKLASFVESIQIVLPLSPLAFLTRKVEGSLQEKLDSLYHFADSSKDIYNSATFMLDDVKKGVAFIEATTCNPTDGTFTYPSGQEYDMIWAHCLNAFWKDKQTFGTRALVFIDDEADKLFAELFSANGNQYNWQAIEELLKKDPKDMKPWEYLALAKVLQGMTTIDKDGKVVTDTEALARFITLGYERSVEYDAYGTVCTVTYHYTIRPAFANLCIVYNDWVDEQVAQNNQLLFNASSGGEQKVAKDYLMQEIVKSTILGQIVARGDHIVQPQSQALKEITSQTDPAPDPAKMTPLEINISNDDYNYSVRFNGFLANLFGDTITVGSSLNVNPGLSINDVQRDLLDTAYRDKRAEFYDSLGNEAYFTIINETLSKWPVAEYLVQAGKFGVDTYYRNREIDLHNMKFDQIKGNIDLSEFLGAFAIGGVVSKVGIDMQLSHCYINESELLLRLLGYNANRGTHIALEELMEQLNPNDPTAQMDPNTRSPLVQDFMKWYEEDVHGSPETLDEYRKKLIKVYDDYQADHPEFRGINLFDLTPDQIIKLAKKEQDPSYDLNLGGTP